MPTALFSPGSLSRNTFTGPALTTFDFSILKNISFREGKNLQFRVEFFNLLNQVNFLQPSSEEGLFQTNPYTGAASVVFNPFFGEILQARAPREIQFALKFTF